MKAVRIYTTPSCPYCNKAKRLLALKGVAFEEIDVDDDPALRAELVSLTGQRTVPQVFIDGVPVGGYSDIAALDQQGELDHRLGLGAQAE